MNTETDTYIAAKCIMALIDAKRIDWHPDCATVARRMLSGLFPERELIRLEYGGMVAASEGQRLFPISPDEAEIWLKSHGVTISTASTRDWRRHENEPSA